MTTQPQGAVTMLTDEQATQKLEQLRRRWSQHRDQKILTLNNIERLRAEVEAACAEAEAQFGTADLDQLRAIVVEARTQNAQALADFEAVLNETDARLAAIATAA